MFFIIITVNQLIHGERSMDHQITEELISNENRLRTAVQDYYNQYTPIYILYDYNTTGTIYRDLNVSEFNDWDNDQKEYFNIFQEMIHNLELVFLQLKLHKMNIKPGHK